MRLANTINKLFDEEEKKIDDENVKDKDNSTKYSEE